MEGVPGGVQECRHKIPQLPAVLSRKQDALSRSFRRTESLYRKFTRVQQRFLLRYQPIAESMEIRAAPNEPGS